MATVTAISTKGGGGGKATLEYICRDDTIGTADIVDSVAGVASIIDNAPTDPEELERYIEAQRAAQSAGLLIGAAVAAIELLSEKLEEMKADAEDIDMGIS